MSRYRRPDRHFQNCCQTLSEKPRRRITDAEVVQMIWRNMQCIKPHCPLLLFGRQIADELNAYFWED
jgi:hypothetical protein